MTEHVVNGCRLILGDCREVIKGLPVIEGLTLCATDPPYPLTSGGGGLMSGATNGGHKRMSGGWMKAYSNNGKLFELCPPTEWMPLVYQCLAADAEIYCMSDAKNLPATFEALSLAAFDLHNVLVWHKRTCTANRWYMKDCEYTVYGWKGRARAINDCSAKQLASAPHQDVTNHPTEKPVALFQHYISMSTKPGETVIDPFMGSGSSAVAAVRAGRPYIGIELDSDYFAAAVERVEAAQPHVDLFSASETEPSVQTDIEEFCHAQ